MSILRLGVYFPSDLYAYFLVTNDPFKKEEYTLGYIFPNKGDSWMESWRTEWISDGRGKKKENKTGVGNMIYAVQREPD